MILNIEIHIYSYLTDTDDASEAEDEKKEEKFTEIKEQ